MKTTIKLLVLSVSLILSTIANAQYIKLLDFAGATNGSSPFGHFISDGTFLYGITAYGGTKNKGVIFKIKPDGTGYAKLLDFTDTVNGSTPDGSLLSDGTFLYGMTYNGGANGKGTIFKIMPNGTGFAKLFDFAGLNGSNPSGSLISDGTFLYGVTEWGGTNNMGTIFKIMPDGTGFAKLLDFAGKTNGVFPFNSLIYDGVYLYGMTENGGINNWGVIFKIKPDGTGYVDMIDFDGTTNGSSSYGSLLSDGTFLYGMTSEGGINNKGVIFKIKSDGTSYTKLLDFDGATNGSFPYGSLLSDGTYLYGMTAYGGLNNLGVLFKIMPDGTGFAKLLDFDGATNGSVSWSTLYSDGNFLYGMTKQGGANNLGVIFKYGIATGISKNNEETNFIISPNPTNGEFQVIVKSGSKCYLEIYNVLGEKVYSDKLKAEKTEIDLSNESNGVYFARMISVQGATVRKIIIDK